MNLTVRNMVGSSLHTDDGCDIIHRPIINFALCFMSFYLINKNKFFEILHHEYEMLLKAFGKRQLRFQMLLWF